VVALASFLAVLALSLMVERTASVALTLTGLSRAAARFQVRSAFTGTGFTTRESEAVVGHPVRRRVIELLMLLRSVGVITAVSSLVLSFANTGSGAERVARLLVNWAKQAGKRSLRLEQVEVNGQPGLMLLTPDGRVASVASLDIADGAVQAVRSVVNPEKLGHLGKVADLEELVRGRRR
jgi:hypothetical protein